MASATTAGRFTAPRVPRRVSGPARKPRTTRQPARTARPRAASEPLAVRTLRRGRTLADSRLLDRLVRGRLWIPLIGVALVGLVFMQLSMLRLNAGIGRDVEAIGKLERDNSVLQAEVSRMESGERVQAAARDLGMVVPAPGSFHYVTAGGSGAGALAAERMQPADREALAQAEAQAVANAQSQAAAPVTTTAPATAATTPTTPAPTTTTATTPAAPATAPPSTTPTQPQPSTPTSTPSSAAPATAAGGAAAPTGADG